MPKKLTGDEEYALQQTALKLGVLRNSLYNLIQFESRWDPKVRNAIGAGGLIQFTNTTSHSLGYADTTDLINKNPTAVKQLNGPVLKYLSQYKPFSGTDQNLFLSVFYPGNTARGELNYRDAPPDTLFPPTFNFAANPGIRTPRDYMNMVYRSAGLKNMVVAAGNSIIGILLGVAVVYFLMRKGGYL